MILYTFPPAPNPRKLAVYLGEKGLTLPTVRVDLLANEQRSPAFLQINPRGTVPVLELDDGTRITESLPIIEYLEEIHPEPPLIGRSARERARVREAERMIDVGVLVRVARLVHARRSPLPGVTGNPETARQEAERLPAILQMVDELIGEQRFVMGDRPTIADCTLFAGLAFGELFDLPVDSRCGRLHRWYGAFKERPSAALVM